MWREIKIPAWKEIQVPDWKKIYVPVWKEIQVPAWKEVTLFAVACSNSLTLTTGVSDSSASMEASLGS